MPLLIVDGWQSQFLAVPESFPAQCPNSEWDSFMPLPDKSSFKPGLQISH